MLDTGYWMLVAPRRSTRHQAPDPRSRVAGRPPLRSDKPLACRDRLPQPSGSWPRQRRSTHRMGPIGPIGPIGPGGRLGPVRPIRPIGLIGPIGPIVGGAGLRAGASRLHVLLCNRSVVARAQASRRICARTRGLLWTAAARRRFALPAERAVRSLRLQAEVQFPKAGGFPHSAAPLSPEGEDSKRSPHVLRRIARVSRAIRPGGAPRDRLTRGRIDTSVAQTFSQESLRIALQSLRSRSGLDTGCWILDTGPVRRSLLEQEAGCPTLTNVGGASLPRVLPHPDPVPSLRGCSLALGYVCIAPVRGLNRGGPPVPRARAARSPWATSASLPSGAGHTADHTHRRRVRRCLNRRSPKLSFGTTANREPRRIFSPKGWDGTARGNAPGTRREGAISPVRAR